MRCIILKPKSCLVCGEEYAPTSGMQKRCSTCRHSYETEQRATHDRTPERRAHSRENANNYHKKLRFDALTAYSVGGLKCACCGENNIEFLAIDHINGGGNQHKKVIGKNKRFYLWLKENNYPEGFRILCHNCNMSFGLYGYCPHEKR